MMKTIRWSLSRWLPCGTDEALGGAAAGAGLGTAILPGIGTAVGAVAGGLYGAFRKKKKARPFYADPFVGSKGFQSNLQGGENQYYDALTRYASRTPGYSQQEKDDLFMLPAEQSKAEETSALRRLNEGAAFGGNFYSGGRMAGRGAILTGFGTARSQMMRQSRIAAAQAELEDRLNQIAALRGYTDVRSNQSLQHSAMKNRYNMSLNDIDQQNWIQSSKNFQDLLGQANTFTAGLGKKP